MTKRMTGREIMPGVVFHVADDIQPETIDALKELAQRAMDMIDKKEIKMEAKELEKRFMYHAPKGDQSQRYESLRGTAKVLAELIEKYCPESREKSLAFTKLEEAVMWANASIARNE